MHGVCYWVDLDILHDKGGSMGSIVCAFTVTIKILIVPKIVPKKEARLRR